MMTETEKRIQTVLLAYGAKPSLVEEYIDDMFAFSDEALYENVTDNEIELDFEDWLSK
jgi:hypothetical protein